MSNSPSTISLERVALPSFGMEHDYPLLSSVEYQGRLRALTARMESAQLDVLVVYGDREHFANLAYLTGFDPRFEEALLLLDRAGQMLLVVGNECMGYLPDPALGCAAVLFQEFSLLGQPREHSRPLRAILADFGIGSTVRVGCVGWKYFDGRLVEDPAHAIDLPGYLVDLLRDLTGGRQYVVNATALLIDPAQGMRVFNSAAQIAQFEFAAIHTSESVLAATRSLRAGVAEYEVARCLDSAGLPLSVHPMISFGEKVRRGLSSPGSGQARVGEMYVIAYGIYGALTCRAGVLTHSAAELSPELRTFYPRLAENYFAVVAEWYRAVKIGALGGEVFARVDARRNPSLYTFAVNPGHYLHLDEWVHSPFTPRSDVVLRSGMVLQSDIIPVSAGPFCYLNAEDGIALADPSLRAELAERYPRCWARMTQRRLFMSEVLGLPLDESVLPLSNTPGWLAPYILDPECALVYR